MRSASALAPWALALLAVVPSAWPKDDLLETLAQKGIITLEEYEKLKAQRKSEVTLNADDGFRISSSDGANTLQVGTLQQLDVAAYDEDAAALADGSEMRRSRISVAGTFQRDWQYRVEYEFAGATALTDAYVSYSGFSPVSLTLGQFKQPFGLEALGADKAATFMERGLPFAFVTTRAPGIMVGNSRTHWTTYAGFFGEPLANAPAGDESYGFVGRATWAPIVGEGRILHVGASVTLRRPTEQNSTNVAGDKFATVRFRSKPESNVLAQRFVDTGEIPDVSDWAMGGLEFGGELGAFSLQGEYQQVQVSRDVGSTLDFSGWYAQAAWSITGEPRIYRADRGTFEGIKPSRPVGSGGYGAFEVAARVSGIDLTDQTILGGTERNATFGFNWYPNNVLRVTLNVVKVLDVKGGAFDGEEPTVYQARLQLAL
jgi:phosphate-selective porin OprO/OprP